MILHLENWQRIFFGVVWVVCWCMLDGRWGKLLNVVYFLAGLAMLVLAVLG